MTRVQVAEHQDDAGAGDQVLIPGDDQVQDQGGPVHETRAEREKRDEPLRYTTYRFVSAIEGESR